MCNHHDHLSDFTATRRTLLKQGGLATIAIAGLGVFQRAGVSAQGPDGSPPSGDGPGGGAPPDGGGGPGGQSDVLDEFVGVTTDGNPIQDLFPVASTGIDRTPVVEAATAFLDALTGDQRAATLFAVDDDEWRKWSNVDGYQRQGTSFREMDENAVAAAYNLLQVALSAAGYEKVDATIKLNHTEGELMNNFENFDEDLYWFTVMGEPSLTDPWGWQLDGHHLVVNYMLVGDQLVMTPLFMGAEPTIAPEGTDYAGLSVLIAEQDMGLALVEALSEEQQAVAVIDSNKRGTDMQAGAGGDNAVIPYAGINAADLSAEQQDQLLALIGQWVNSMPDEDASIKMDDVRAHLDETWFAWIGDTGPDAVFYYRIQSPVVLIEFDHQEPGPLGRSSDYYQGASGPQRAHIHSIIRTPNGNDYGKDLLAEHYATSDHHATPEATPLAAYFWNRTS